MIVRFVATAIVFAATLFGADSQLLRYLPPDAALIAGVDVAAARGTAFGEYVLAATERHAAHLDALESATGFNPRTDLLEVAIGGDIMRGPDGDRVVVARARYFNIPAIIAWARSKGAVVDAVNGATVISGSRQRDTAMAFPSDNIVVLGRPESVRAALARAAAGAGPGTDVTNSLAQVSMGRHAWFLITGSPAGLVGKIDDDALAGAMQGDIIRSIEEISGGFYFGPSVEFKAQARTTTTADAEALANVVDFFASLAQLQADPEATAALRTALGEGPVVTGNVVTVDFSMPEADLEKLLAQERHQHSQERHPHGAAASR